jgi:hypothetical protein
MQESTHSVEIFREGDRVAKAAVVTSRFQPRAEPVPITGTQAVGYKDLSTQGPTTIRIEQPDPAFREELERLQAGARDIEVGRRDRQWRPEPVTVKVGDSIYDGCGLDRPLNPYGSLEETEFDLHHPDL